MATEPGTETIQNQGWLEIDFASHDKAENGIGQWKTRYFLFNSVGKLYCVGQALDKTTTVEILLNEKSLVAALPKQYKFHYNCFRVISDEQTIVLSATSTIDRDLWVRELNKFIENTSSKSVARSASTPVVRSAPVSPVTTSHHSVDSKVKASNIIKTSSDEPRKATSSPQIPKHSNQPVTIISPNVTNSPSSRSPLVRPMHSATTTEPQGNPLHIGSNSTLHRTRTARQLSDAEISSLRTQLEGNNRRANTVESISRHPEPTKDVSPTTSQMESSPSSRSNSMDSGDKALCPLIVHSVEIFQDPSKKVGTLRQSVICKIEKKMTSEFLFRESSQISKLHKKLEAALPDVMKNMTPPPTFKEKNGALDPDLKLQTQLYLNQLTQKLEIIKMEEFVQFVDAFYKPPLIALDSGERSGAVKMNVLGLPTILASWVERHLVVKSNFLYCFKDILSPYAFPVATIKLNYCVFNAPANNSYIFEIKSLSNGKDYIFKTSTEEERNDWIIFLRGQKAKDKEKDTGTSMLSSSSYSFFVASSPNANEEKKSDLLRGYITGQETVKRKVTEKRFDTPLQSMFIPEKDSDSNVLLSQDKGSIKAATKEKLLEKLTDEGQDMDFVRAFLLTYRSFSTPKYLLDYCIHRFRNPPVKENSDNTKMIHPTQLRVITILFSWLECNFSDFVEDNNLTNELLSFIEHDLASQKLEVMAKKLRTKIKKKILPEPKQKKELQGFPVPELPLLFSSGAWEFFELSPLEVSRQMCLIEHDLFKKIQPKECLKKMDKSEKDVSKPNVTAVIKRFNHGSAWVVTEILRIEELKPRIAMLNRFIEIGATCLELNNYNSTMQVVSALNSAPIHRLTLTWDGLSSSTRETFSKLETVLSVNKSYKNYREMLNTRQPPCAPYFGVLLTDLTFVDEGNPDKLQNGLINFEKLGLFYKLISQMQLYQQTPYNFQPVPEMQEYLLSREVLDEKEAFALSLKCEPRVS